MVRSPMKSGWSAATQVKVVQPRNVLLAMGQGLVCPEASIVTGVINRRRRERPAEEPCVGNPQARFREGR